MGKLDRWRYGCRCYQARKAEPAPTKATLRGLWGAAPNDIWAVGDRGSLVHYDGASWRPVTAVTDRDLHAVWGRSRMEVWAVGQGGTVLRFDGKSWSAEASSTATTLRAVHGADGKEHKTVWAVGLGGLILERNTAWSRAQSKTSRHLYGVSWIAPGTVWAAGQGGEALLRDKKGWSKVTTGTEDDLLGIWGAGGWVWALSSGGALVRLGVKGDVRAVPAAGAPRAGMEVPAGIPRTPAHGWMVGDKGAVLRSPWPWSGASWNLVPSGLDADLHGLCSDGAGGIWAVGAGGSVVRIALQKPSPP
jgi:hypothetical protein